MGGGIVAATHVEFESGWGILVCALLTTFQDTETYDLLHSLGFEALLDPIVHFGEASQRTGFRAHVHVQSMLFCMLHQVTHWCLWKQTTRVSTSAS